MSRNPITRKYYRSWNSSYEVLSSTFGRWVREGLIRLSDTDENIIEVGNRKYPTRYTYRRVRVGTPGGRRVVCLRRIK